MDSDSILLFVLLFFLGIVLIGCIIRQIMHDDDEAKFDKKLMI